MVDLNGYLAHTVWRPDIVLYNNDDGNYDPTVKTNVIIKSNGVCEWMPPAIYKEGFHNDADCNRRIGNHSLKIDKSPIAKFILIYFLSIGRIVQWFFARILMTGMIVIKYKLFSISYKT